MTGAFQAAAVELHRHGLAVIPTGGADGKAPLVRGWNRWRGQARQTVEALAQKHDGANVAILTGLSRLTVIDADDERTLADAEGRFGRSPIVTRSPRGGGHLYFKSGGERNANLRAHGLNVDVRGVGGLVLAPPSVRSGIGAYRIERGGWDDLPRLPTIARGSLPAIERPDRPAQVRHRTTAPEGERNNALFLALKAHALDCESLEALILEGHAINAQFAKPVELAEVVKTAKSVWNYKSTDRLITKSRPGVVVPFSDLDDLGADGLYLLVVLRRNHGAKPGVPFALATKAMVRHRTIPGWGRARYCNAISQLLHCGRLRLVRRGGKCKGDPHLYCLTR